LTISNITFYTTIRILSCTTRTDTSACWCLDCIGLIGAYTGTRTTYYEIIHTIITDWISTTACTVLDVAEVANIVELDEVCGTSAWGSG